MVSKRKNLDVPFMTENASWPHFCPYFIIKPFEIFVTHRSHFPQILTQKITKNIFYQQKSLSSTEIQLKLVCLTKFPFKTYLSRSNESVAAHHPGGNLDEF